jgi:hypothetical protein
MPRVKQIALSDPPSQEPLEGGSDSALPFTSNTVASSYTKNAGSVFPIPKAVSGAFGHDFRATHLRVAPQK